MFHIEPYVFSYVFYCAYVVKKPVHQHFSRLHEGFGKNQAG